MEINEGTLKDGRMLPCNFLKDMMSVLTKIIDTRPPNSYFFPSTEYEKNSQLSMIKKGLA